MAADVFVNQKASNLDVSTAFNGYSRVVVKTGQLDSNGNEIAYIAGNTNGRTLEVTNPWGNQTIANAILNKIRGWAYQPYESGNATVNPAYEVGDAVVVGDVFSGIYDSRAKFSRLFLADIRAPEDKEINHEYAYESPEERKYTRQLNNITASLDFYANQISAKVSKTGGSTSSFGWTLTDSKWSVYSNGTEVFKIDSSGATVQGTIKAKGGTIGGFTIGTSAIYNNISSFGGSQSTGVYVGTNGIQLGNTFKVNSSGSLTATSGSIGGFTITTSSIYNGISSFGGSGNGVYVGINGIQCGAKFRANNEGNIIASGGTIGGFTITGSSIYNGISSFGASGTGVYIGTNGIQCGSKFKVDSQGNLTASGGTFTGNIAAKNIVYGGSNGTINGDAIASGTVGTTQFDSGINTSLGYANFSNQVFNNRSRVKYMDCEFLYSTVAANLNELIISSNRFQYGSYAVTWQSAEVVVDVSIEQGDYKGIVQMTNGNYYTCRGTPTVNLSYGTYRYLGR